MKTAEPMVDSPVKRVGGKSKMRKVIIDLLPADAECFVEVFAGAAWVLFGKESHAVEVLNDADGHLVNLWRVMKWRKAELLEGVHQYLYSREMFMELRQWEPEGKCEMERAVWYYLLIQMAFGADLSDTQKPGFGFRNKSRGDLFLIKSLYQFDEASKRLRGVFIENSDFSKVIKRYDQPRTIFFCDPPYLGTCGYAEAFGMEQHIALRDKLKAIEGRFLLTINDTPETREFLFVYNFFVYGVARALARASEGRVAAPILIITNYNPSDTPGQQNLFTESEGENS
jgi:DNA adenine methylase